MNIDVMHGNLTTDRKPLTNAERQARWRARRKAEKAAAIPTAPPDPSRLKQPGRVLATWAGENLIIPAPHRNAGQPFHLPPYLVRFLNDAGRKPESLLCIARKNAKSAAIAIYALGRLCGPLAYPNWRGACLSISKEKAAELKAQMEAIAEASNLEGLEFRKSPAPGHVLGPHGGKFEILAEGHASSLDDAVIDELGLLQEKDRETVNSMRSSVSARGGRFIALSIHGSGPFIPEILKRKGQRGLAIHHYTAPEGAALDDRKAWKAANPGLRTVKELSYMKQEAARVEATPADVSSFMAYDMNQPLDPTEEVILTPSDLKNRLFTDDPPPREGPAVLAFDFGEAKSGSSAFAIWPQSGRCEAWLAFGSVPSLRDRARADDAPYLEMKLRGELKTYDGRITPISAFLRDVAAELEGVEILHCACDPYRRSEAQDYLDTATGWQLTHAEGVKGHARDVRALTRLVHAGRLKMTDNLPFVSAIAKHRAIRDQAGNPLVNKRRSRGRIDVLSAALIAAGLSERYFDNPAILTPEPWRVIYA